MKKQDLTTKVSINAADKAGILRFYEFLVPDWNLLNKPCNVEIFLSAFPTFEQTVGKKEFAKIKKYFGIGVKKNFKYKFDSKIEGLVKKLRTVQNAMFYIAGYSNLIEKVAKKLDKAPDYMGDLEKVKILRAYFYIFVGGNFFSGEYRYMMADESNPITIIDRLVKVNNQLLLTPEDLELIYDRTFIKLKDKSYIYDSILYEINQLDKKTRADFLDFAELAEIEGKFISVNKASNFQTFGEVRKIKKKAMKEPTFFPVNVYADKKLFNMFEFSGLYSAMKILSNIDFSELPKKVKIGFISEGSLVKKVEYNVYLLQYKSFFHDLPVAGKIEKGRLFSLIDTLVKYEYQFPIETNTYNSIEYINFGHYIAAYKYAFAKGYISIDSDFEYDFEVLRKIVELPGAKSHLLHLWYEEESLSDFERNLEIDIESIDQLIWEIKESFSPVAEEASAAISFAIEAGCISDSNKAEATLMLDAYLPILKQNFLDYSKDNNLKKLKKEIGFDEDFSKMYFNLRNIKVTQIEEKLLELKRNSANIKHYKLLILLYAWLVDNQIPCGVKNKPIKRKKNLKTEILLDLVK